MLLLFQVITGLSINFGRSYVYHISNDADSVQDGIEILGCQFVSLAFRYLGAWVGADVKKMYIMEAPQRRYGV